MTGSHPPVLASLIAAIIHDVDHPGFNNAYMVMSQSDLGTPMLVSFLCFIPAGVFVV